MMPARDQIKILIIQHLFPNRSGLQDGKPDILIPAHRWGSVRGQVIFAELLHPKLPNQGKLFPALKAAYLVRMYFERR